MTAPHRLVRRQLAATGLADESAWPDGLRRFVALVDEAYCESDADRVLLERSLELSSRELLDVNADMRAVIRVFPDAFLWLSMDGTVTGARGNSALKLPPHATLVGQRIQAFLPAAAGDLITAALRDIAAGKKRATVEFEMADQRFETRLTPLGGGRVLAIVRDVSDRHETERSLRDHQERLNRSQKLEAVGLLAGGVAHDFNNVLTAITGFSSVLLDEPLSPNQREWITKISAAAEGAASLTSQLLAFSRRQLLHPRVVDLNAAVSRVEGLLQRVIGADIVVRAHLGAEQNVTVDPGQMDQIIMNLALNARDAMPDGGELVIETSNAPDGTIGTPLERLAAPGPHVKLTVRDTGVGMDAETQERIFEPFFTTKEPGKGTGLGLATVYGIVKQCGGFIWVDSAVGCGTTFTILLPSTTAPAVDARRVETETADPRPGTILLTEDEPDVREVAVMMLERRGYTVLPAATGIEAIRIARGHPGTIDLLFTDVVMPGMGGRELADRVARERPHIRVLYASGYADHDMVGRGVLDSGATFIQKPFTAAGLMGKIQEALA